MLADYVATIDDPMGLVGEPSGSWADFMENVRRGGWVLQRLPPEIWQFQALPPTEGFESASAFPSVTTALLARLPIMRCWIMGDNSLHLYSEVWSGCRLAKFIRKEPKE
jgi:hypothetical protein